MIFHVLNGDELATKFPLNKISGEIIVVRECLIEGPLKAKDLNDFWGIRSQFITETYSENKERYFNRVVSEFEKIKNLPKGSEINLWFENDLFCQANMWFLVSLLNNHFANLNIYRVFPVIKNPGDLWNGFSHADKESLTAAYTQKIKFEKTDLELGSHLWHAYQKNDLDRLRELSLSNSLCFPHLKEVAEAHIDRFAENSTPGRPERVLKEIIAAGTIEFKNIYREFFSREGIYGFGDVQIKKLLDKISSS